MTGVQTCALPICELLELLERLCPDEKGLHDEGREEVRELLGDKKGK